VEVAARCDVETFGGGVRRDDEVGAGGEGVPVMIVNVLFVQSFRSFGTYQQIRCFSILKSAPFLP